MKFFYRKLLQHFILFYQVKDKWRDLALQRSVASDVLPFYTTNAKKPSFFFFSCFFLFDKTKVPAIVSGSTLLTAFFFWWIGNFSFTGKLFRHKNYYGETFVSTKFSSKKHAKTGFVWVNLSQEFLRRFYREEFSIFQKKMQPAKKIRNTSIFTTFVLCQSIHVSKQMNFYGTPPWLFNWTKTHFF